MKRHNGLGYIGQDRLLSLVKNGLISSLIMVSLPPCELCLAGKVTKKSFDEAKRISALPDLIYSDICGPISVRS